MLKQASAILTGGSGLPLGIFQFACFLNSQCGKPSPKLKRTQTLAKVTSHHKSIRAHEKPKYIRSHAYVTGFPCGPTCPQRRTDFGAQPSCRLLPNSGRIYFGRGKPPLPAFLGHSRVQSKSRANQCPVVSAMVSFNTSRLLRHVVFRLNYFTTTCPSNFPE